MEGFIEQFSVRSTLKQSKTWGHIYSSQVKVLGVSFTVRMIQLAHVYPQEATCTVHEQLVWVPCDLQYFSIQALVQLGKERRARLEDSLRLYKFFGDMEEEEMFVKETEKVLSSKDVGNDLTSLTRLQQKHKVSDTGKGWAYQFFFRF